MTNASLLTQLSNEFATLVAAAAPSVVQVHGRHRPGTGIVYAEDVVLTTTRSLGREDGLRVVRADGSAADAELAGWDPATNLAVLRVPKLGLPPFTIAPDVPPVGSVAVAVARSWSNAVTASAGIVAVIGGPLQTGRRRAIEQIVRTTAPMHDGFSGGAFLGVDGRLLGVTTAAAIRGLGVVIPAAIAWRSASTLLEHGSLKRGYLGIAGQPVTLVGAQQAAAGQDHGVLVVNVAAGGPAATGGLLVGDIVLALDGDAIGSPDDLVDRLTGRVGQPVRVRLLRGGSVAEVTIVVGERDGR